MRRDEFVLASVEFVDVVAVGVLLPLLSATARRFGLGGVGAAALVAVPVVAAIVAAVWLAPLSARWGRKPVLVATCLVTAEALFVLAWAGDVYMLFMSRVATGIAAGNIAVAEASRRDLVDDGGSGSGVGLPAVSMGLGLIAGVLLGLVLGGWSASAAAYTAGAVAVVSLMGVVALLHETLPVSERGRVLSRERVHLR